jgi:hypothetical protein
MGLLDLASFDFWKTGKQVMCCHPLNIPKEFVKILKLNNSFVALTPLKKETVAGIDLYALSLN